MSPQIILILGVLSAFGPLAIDFNLPAFPEIARGLGTDLGAVQLSLASYFVGLAMGQLVYGPVMDRFGRRQPLLCGIALLAFASLLCAWASSMHWLVGARFLQALGGAAGMVISRAVVRDLCTPAEGAKAFSQLMLVTGLAPILAPLAGGWLLGIFGWRGIFYSLAVISALVWVLVFFRLPETLPASAGRPPLRGALGRYGALLSDREFMAYALASAVALAGLFAYISGSPYVFIELYGVPAKHFGWLFGAHALAFILASQINARLMRFAGPSQWLRRVVWLYAFAGLALLTMTLLRPASLLCLLLPLFAVNFFLGFILPNSTLCAMARQGKQAGSASALMGSLQFFLGAAASTLMGFLHNETAIPMGAMLAACGLLSALLVWLAGQTTLGSLSRRGTNALDRD